LPNFIFPNLLEKIYHGLELFSGVLGLIGICYGLKLILVERAQVPLCSLELLQQQQRELLFVFILGFLRGIRRFCGLA